MKIRRDVIDLCFGVLSQRDTGQTHNEMIDLKQMACRYLTDCIIFAQSQMDVDPEREIRANLSQRVSTLGMPAAPNRLRQARPLEEQSIARALGASQSEPVNGSPG